MTKTKIGWRKAIYLVMALALAIGLVPGVASVAQAQYTPPPITLDGAVAYNVLGSEVTFVASGAVDHWNVTWQDQIHPWIVAETSKNITLNCLGLDTGYEGGAAYIEAYMVNGSVESGMKSWGKIDATVLTPMVYSWIADDWVPATTRQSVVRFNENRKAWEGEIVINETVLGSYNTNNGVVEIPADGAVVDWYVVDSSAKVSVLAGLTSFDAIQAAILAMPDADLIDLKWGEGWRGHRTETSGYVEQGVCYQKVRAEGPQACYIIAVAHYPDSRILEPVHAEIEYWNFKADTVTVVPQVRWVGEKIVLEKYFGDSYTGGLAHFEASPGGKLEDTDLAYGDSDYMDTPTSVWTPIEDGIARAILECGDAIDVQVLCTVYDWYSPNRAEMGNIVNEHLFLVYFLKLEDITLGNVEGERVDNPLTGNLTNPVVEGHNSGIFDPANPWANPWGLEGVSDEDYMANGGVVGPVDPTTGELNISQDTLLRARVRGYFEGNLDSGRASRQIDSNHDGKLTTIGDAWLPAGRWVLPDDWQYLASTDWDGYNAYWDIMDQPNDDIMSDANGDPNPELSWDDLGCYVEWGVDEFDGNAIIIDEVKEWPVVGPYSSLDTYTNWRGRDASDLIEGTIVPNGYLNWWDCPMPPALVTFSVRNGLGYFKEVDKADVYYELLDTDVGYPNPDAIAYTSPFYALCIPANQWLQDMAFVADGRYLWNTWDEDYQNLYDAYDRAWYNLWDFVSQNETRANYPTEVQVYSDNHGEAMVWLNGDNSLNLNGQASWWDGDEWTTEDYVYYVNNTAHSVTTTGWAQWTTIVSHGGTVKVGNTTAMAAVNYPYFIADPALYSLKVTKEWTWGEEKIVDVIQMTVDQDQVPFGHKLVLVWLKDRDGMMATGSRVEWTLVGNALFLNGTDANSAGLPVTLIDDHHAVSVSWKPGPEMTAQYWNSTKLVDYAVAGIEVSGNAPDAAAYVQVRVFTAEGSILHEETLMFYQQDMLDPALSAGLNTGVYMGPAQRVVDAIETIGPEGQNTLVAIWWQDNGGVWHAYQPGAPDWANDLSMLEPGNTYWVSVSADCFWNWALN